MSAVAGQRRASPACRALRRHRGGGDLGGRALGARRRPAARRRVQPRRPGRRAGRRSRARHRRRDPGDARCGRSGDGRDRQRRGGEPRGRRLDRGVLVARARPRRRAQARSRRAGRLRADVRAGSRRRRRGAVRNDQRDERRRRRDRRRGSGPRAGAAGARTRARSTASSSDPPSVPTSTRRRRVPGWSICAPPCSRSSSPSPRCCRSGRLRAAVRRRAHDRGSRTSRRARSRCRSEAPRSRRRAWRSPSIRSAFRLRPGERATVVVRADTASSPRRPAPPRASSSCASATRPRCTCRGRSPCPARRPRLAASRCETTGTRVSDATPAALSFVAGSVTAAPDPQVRAVELLEVELWRGGTRIGAARAPARAAARPLHVRAHRARPDGRRACGAEPSRSASWPTPATGRGRQADTIEYRVR